MAKLYVDINRTTDDWIRAHATPWGQSGFARTRYLLRWMLDNDIAFIPKVDKTEYWTAIKPPRTTMLFTLPMGFQYLLDKFDGNLGAGGQRETLGLLMDCLAEGFVVTDPPLPEVAPAPYDYTLFRLSDRAARAFRFLCEWKEATYREVATELSTFEYRTTTNGQIIYLPPRYQSLGFSLDHDVHERFSRLVEQFNIKTQYRTANQHKANLALEAILNGTILPNHPEYATFLAGEGY